MSKPKLALIPSGYKSGKVYSILPNDGSGDFDYERNGNATRVRKDGLIEELTVDDTPRLDWLNSNCPSLLLEPQRTNYIKYSQDITQSIWNKRNVNYSSNFIDPSGNTNAFKIYPDTVNTEHYLEQTLSITTATTYTASVFLKDGGTSNFEIIIVHVGVGIAVSRALFTIADGVISFSSSTGIIQNVELKDFSNGWYRCEVKYNWTGTVTSHRLRILPRENGTYVGDNINGVYVYGMQVEQASYPTSYIKTEASTVTRLKDECLNSGSADLFNSVEGVIYAEFKNHTELGSFRQINLKLNSSNRIYISKRSDNGKLEFRMENPLGSRNFSFVQNTSDDYIKVAFRYAPNNFAVFINGVNKNVSSSGSTFAEGTLTTLEFASPLANQNFYGKVKDLRVYNEALTDAQLIQLTK